MKWLMAIVIAAGLIRLGDTQPPDDSREPDEVEQDVCEMTDIEEQQDTQAQASSNGTEASGYAAQTSLDDKHNKEDIEFVEKLMDGWGGHEFFLSPAELDIEEKKYQKWRGNNKLRPECGRMRDVEGREWYVVCPKMKDGKRYSQYADVGTCV
nr:hypothetical protein BaRGS_007569 [Batillaria attramentaria]